ncbi:proline-rich protein 15-like protein B [Scyliorhinus canicula]|uniref:proline-rich protein 15-like protein B n=1 Tax=Scyliorhinus canicula TaxID=7830 RepID=UPI0018F5EB82|nr:proline-rich protein 15-like protein B [Scyliorhinus canicula]
MGDGAASSWWKFTFLRKRNSPKVVYEVPVERSHPDSKDSTDRERESPGRADSELQARLEKIVDKSTKGRHVRVSNSGRFKEKKKVRSSLVENPSLYNDAGSGGGPQP